MCCVVLGVERAWREGACEAAERPLPVCVVARRRRRFDADDTHLTASIQKKKRPACPVAVCAMSWCCSRVPPPGGRFANGGPAMRHLAGMQRCSLGAAMDANSTQRQARTARPAGDSVERPEWTRCADSQLLYSSFALSRATRGRSRRFVWSLGDGSRPASRDRPQLLHHAPGSSCRELVFLPRPLHKSRHLLRLLPSQLLITRRPP